MPKKKTPLNTTARPQTNSPKKKTTPKTMRRTTVRTTNKTPAKTDLHERIQQHLQDLKVPLPPDELDEIVAASEQRLTSYLDFLERVLNGPANRRRENGIARRIRQAGFRNESTLENFNWKFNAASIDRAQIEQLARTNEFCEADPTTKNGPACHRTVQFAFQDALHISVTKIRGDKSRLYTRPAEVDLSATPRRSIDWQ